MKYSVYIAGPEVFHSNASLVAERQKALCHKYGFEPLHPTDSDTDSQEGGNVSPFQIFNANISLINRAHIVVANCELFRGGCMDDGTAMEIGYTYAQKKLCYGYVATPSELNTKILKRVPHVRDARERWCDGYGYVLTPDFGTKVNLMIQMAITATGRLIIGDFEACIRALRSDITTNNVKIGMQGRTTRGTQPQDISPHW